MINKTNLILHAQEYTQKKSKTLDVKLIKANQIDRNGRNPDGSKNIDYQDEEFLDIV